MAELIATKSFTYATRRLLPGQDFATKSARDARLLIAIGKARRKQASDTIATPPAKPVQKVAGTDPELATLRANYQTATGKKPYHGWSADQLREKIAESQAS